MKTNSLDFDAQALREKILDLAMRGKLVKQDPNDEPASVLLEKIKAEKAQLVKEGKIKKSKALPEIADDEKPFELPEGWTWVRLNDILALENGAIRRGPFGSSLKKVFFVPKGKDTYKVYEQGNAINHTIDYGNYYITAEKYNELSSFATRPGDIIISGAGTIGRTYILPADSPQGVINQALIRVRINEDIISKEYFLLAFGQKVNLLNKQAKGTAIKNMFSVSHMKKDLVWGLPPLEEQSRIAAKIAQLFALLRKVESSTQQYAKLQTLLKAKVLDLAMRGKLVKHDPNDKPASVLLEKIKAEKEQLIKEKKIKKSKPLPPITDEEKPFEIPDSWEWVRLGDLTAPVEYAMADGPFGSNLKKADYTLEPEVRIIQLSNIGENGWKDKNKKYTTFKHLEDIQRSEVFPGNIVIAKMMPTGRAIIVPNKDKKYVLSSDAVKFIPNQHILKSFLLCAINGPVYRKQVNSKLQGSTRPRTSLKKLKNFVLPLPPLSEQKRIAAKIAQLFALLRKDESLN